MAVEKIGVVGAGKMGNGIALTAAMAGYSVVLQNRTQTNLDKAGASIEKQLNRLVEKKTLTAEQSIDVMARISMTSTFENYEKLDFIIEVVAESLEIKNDIYQKLDTVMKPEAVLVTSTSTFSITALANATQRPENFAGMHFFLPPSKLVEIIRGEKTSAQTVETAKKVAGEMGKISVDVLNDSPGFIANRIYTPLFVEAFRAYDEGLASIADIDLAMKSTYLPIGPFELADIIGLDVILSSLGYYEKELGAQWKAPQSLINLVNAGHLGKKTGKGWYDYTS